MNLQQLRNKINKIDAEIISLLAKRQSLMPTIGRNKKKMGLPINDPKREKEILEKLQKLAIPRKLDPKLIRKIFKSIFNNSRGIQRVS